MLAYNWYLQDGTQLYGQYQSHNFDNVAFPDTFWCMLVVTDAIGCSDTLTLNAYTGDTLANPNWPLPDAIDEEVSGNNSISVYPNPFDDRVTVKFKAGQMPDKILVYDLTGKACDVSYTQSQNQLIIDGSSLSTGMYFLQIPGYGNARIVKR